MDKVYKVTHKNHPCTRWVRESKDNYLWTLEHLKGLLREYTYRYNKRHKSGALLPYLSQVLIYLTLDKQNHHRQCTMTVDTMTVYMRTIHTTNKDKKR